MAGVCKRLECIYEPLCNWLDICAPLSNHVSVFVHILPLCSVILLSKWVKQTARFNLRGFDYDWFSITSPIVCVNMHRPLSSLHYTQIALNHYLLKRLLMEDNTECYLNGYHY